MASLTDPRRDLNYIQSASQHQSGVATEDPTLNNSFSLNHTSSVATSFTCCLDHSGRKLNLQVTTSLAKVFYFFLKIDLGDVVTWK